MLEKEVAKVMVALGQCKTHPTVIILHVLARAFSESESNVVPQFSVALQKLVDEYSNKPNTFEVPWE